MTTPIITGPLAKAISELIPLNTKEVPAWFKTKEVSVNKDTEKKKIIKLFRECESFEIKGKRILFRVERSQEEKEEWLKSERASSLDFISMLREWFNASKEKKEYISSHLKNENLDWILDEIINGK